MRGVPKNKAPDKSCARCGAMFSPKGRQLYCSSKCRAALWASNNRWCGAASTKRWYHNNTEKILARQQARRDASKKPGPTIHCVICQKPFLQIEPRHVACSLRCSRQKRYRNKPEIYRDRYRMKNQKNPEKSRARSRAYYLCHKDQYHSYSRVRRRQLRKTHPWMQCLDSARHRAKKANRKFNLTWEWAIERWTGRCEITGILFDLEPKSEGGGPRAYAASIDRIDPSGGYVIGNCRFILFAVNSLKHDATDDDMYRIASAVTASRKEFLLDGLLSLPG